MKSNSAFETKAFGKRLGATLKPGAIVALKGDLGSGKTTLIKGIVSAFSKESDHCVTSPTFNYVNTYQAKVPIHHFDLYRIKDAEEFTARGFSDYFDKESLCCIEWPEKITSLLPTHTLFIELAYLEEDKRFITEGS